jgi:hypothetical protein
MIFFKTNEEFRKTMNGFKSGMKVLEKERNYYKPVLNSLPPTIDWRRFGYVTDIKDQGQCGMNFLIKIVIYFINLTRLLFFIFLFLLTHSCYYILHILKR